MRNILLVMVLGSFVATPALAQTPWIHVAVDEAATEAGVGNTRVNVNLPLSIVRIALQAAPDDVISDGKVRLEHVDQEIDVESLRQMWTELRASGDAELVTVEEHDGTVRIRRDGDLVRIDIEERDDGNPERVRVDIPVRVVDALFSGEGETLDIERALDELSNERGDIVNVNDGETKVRVWIDEKD